MCLLCTIRCHVADSAAAAAPGDGGILEEVCFQLTLKMSFIIALKQTKALASLFFALLGSNPATAQASQVHVDSENAL